MASPLIEHLLKIPATPHPDLATHNTSLLSSHALLFMAIASDLEREYGQPITWSGTRHLPWPGNTPPSGPHFTLGTSGANISIGFEIIADGTVVLYGEPPITPLSPTFTDDTAPASE